MSGQSSASDPDPKITIEELFIRIAELEANLARAQTWACIWKAGAHVRRAAMRDMVTSRNIKPTSVDKDASMK